MRARAMNPTWNTGYKRLMDMFFSALGLLFFAPLMLLTAVSIKLDSRGPVFFRQDRVGLGGRHFLIYKFRTMFEDSESRGLQITGDKDERITRLGRYLRKYKIDEVPQLINVLKGDMSIVGPRPQVPKYVELFREEYEKILAVRPGITSYASLEYSNENEILGRSDDPERLYIDDILPRKLELNMRYIEEMSFMTDMRIIIRTIVKVLENK